MDLREMLNNAMAAKRAEEMKNSTQLTIGEIVLKLEAIADKEKLITFDMGKYVPTGLGSWRGSYAELCINYEGGGETAYEQPKDTCKRDEMFGYHAYDCPCGSTKEHSLTLPKKPKVKDLLALFKIVQGKYLVGYKGGDFTMGKTTPVWVANYGDSSGFRKDTTAVIDIIDKKEKAVIKTAKLDY